MVHRDPFTPGLIEVYCGPMKSGKSKTLFARVDPLPFMNETKFIFFKPDVDTRDNTIHSRGYPEQYPCHNLPSKKPEDVFKYLKGEKVVLFDEAQFFGKTIVPVVYSLAQMGLNVVLAGLDTDYRREPFGSMPDILAIANYVEKLTGVCEHHGCNQKGTYTQRNKNIPGQVVIENSPDLYSVMCLKHHRLPDNENEYKIISLDTLIRNAKTEPIKYKDAFD
jgi:thymidine kinase